MIRYSNKLDVNSAKLNIITEELSQYFSSEKLEEIKKMNRGVYQLLIWELLVYELNKTYNPFDFISSEFIINRFEKEEVDIIKYYCEVMNYLKYNLKIKFRICKSYDLKKLYDELKNFLNSQKMNLDLIFESNLDYAKISKVYYETRELIPQGAKPAFYERMFNEIIRLSNKQYKSEDISGIYPGLLNAPLGTIREENSIINQMNQSGLNKLQLLANIGKKEKKTVVTFNDIPIDIVVKHMLFFLDINSLPKFSMANKKSNEAVKTHIFIRLYFLNKEKKLIEQENGHVINSVEEKRKNFYSEYEIEAPNKDHACQLMNTLSADDIVEIRQCFKKFNKQYENIIAPLVILLGGKAQTTINPDGSKTTSFFYPAQKILNNKDFVRKLKNLELETIPHSRFKSVEKIIESPNFDIEKIRQLSPCLHHLLSWVIGK